jgi:hypothetical protein
MNVDLAAARVRLHLARARNGRSNRRAHHLHRAGEILGRLERSEVPCDDLLLLYLVEEGRG